MSETEQEIEQPETEPTPEPDVPLEEPEPDVTPEAEPEAEPEPTAPPGETDTEIEALYGKLETKAKNYTKALADLLEGSNLPVAGCEMCADCYPGIRWIEAQDETHATLLSVVGAAGGASPLRDDPDALLCERCYGFGWTKLPSHVPGNTTRVCKTCNGAGWLDQHPESGAPVAPATAPANGGAEVLPGVPETEDWVVQARARGFTIIPPMQIAGAEQQG